MNLGQKTVTVVQAMVVGAVLLRLELLATAATA